MPMQFRGQFSATAASAAARAGAQRGLRLGAEHVLGEAMRLVPNEEGTLERSGRVSVDDGALTAAISFDTVYAVAQHERLDYRHSGGRTAKYLERPLTTESATVSELIAAEIRRALR